MMPGQPRKVVGCHLFVIFAIIFFLPLSAEAQLAESLYVDSSFSTRPITNEANCYGAPDGAEASINGKLAQNADTWTFDFDSTAYSGQVITSAEIFITHRQSSYRDDSLLIEYYDGTNFIPFESFANVPTSLTTVGPFPADSIINTGQLNGFRVRMRGVLQNGGPDKFTYYVDAIELRLTYQLNQPPNLDPIPPQAVDEGGHLDIRVTASDPDVGDIITLTAENLPANANFSDSTSGVGGLTFDPDYTQSGFYQIDIIATDQGGLADTVIIDITVNNVDRPPVLDPISPQTVAEGSHLDLRVTASDPDGDPIALVAELTPPNSAFFDSTGGVGGFTFDPDYTQSGLHQVRFIASSNSFADTQLVDITVTDVDQPPVLDPISPQTVAEGGHLDLRVTASDPDGDPISLVAELLPPNSAFFDSTGGVGGFTFDPDYTQSGPHQVRFIANSNSLADTQLVDITVTEVDRPPVLDPISPQTLAEGGHLDLRVTASDPDGDPISLVAELTPPNSAFFDSTGGVGGFTFDPDYTQSGPHQVRFIANSNSLADTQLVDITVTDVDQPPVLDPISPQTVAEGSHLDLRVTASDPDGDPISLVAELTPPNSAFFDSTGGVGGFTFDPDYTQSGPHQVRFIANSNSLADTQLVDITVTDVDLPPVLDPISPQTVAEGGHLDLRVTASDPDGDPISLVAELTPPNSAFFDSTGGVGGFTFDPDYTQSGLHQVRFIANSNSLADTQLVDITVTEVDRPPVLDPISPQILAEGDHLDLRVTASDLDGDPISLVAELTPPNSAFFDSTGGVGGFTFDPDYTQSGPHQVRFIANSNSLADTQLVDITVTDVDQPPVLDPISPQTVAEGGHLDLRVTASDPDGDPISLVAELTPPNSAFFDSTGGVGGFTFDPDYTQSGPHQVRFIANSNSLADTQLVDITVTEVDRPPVLDPIPPQVVAEGDHLDLRVTASDPDGDAIGLVAELTPPNSAFFDSTGGVGGFTFDPDYTQSGLHQVRFIANSNSLADTQLVDITVTNVDLPPVLDPISPQTVAEGGHLDLRVTASDPDGDAIGLVAELLPPNSAFFDSTGGVGGFTFDPDYTQSGPHQVRFIANSNSLADTQLVDITVMEVDRPPVLDPISPQVVAEGDHLDLRVTASDPDGDPISLVAELTPPNSAFFDSTGGVGGFTFDPDYTQSGLHQVRFIANSNSLADTQLVDITVTNVDLPPVLGPISPQTVAEGGHLDLRVTASDPDGDAIGLVAELLPPNSAFFDSTGGVGGFTFDPDYTQSGPHQVRFIANSNSLADTQLVDITVTEVDRPPVLDPISPQVVAEGNHLDLRVTASDADGDAIGLVAELLPPNSAFFDSTGGVGGFTFDPDYTQSGPHQVRFIANSNSLADTQLVDITVMEVDRPPVLDPISPQVVAEGDHLDLRVTASDPDGDPISLVAELTPPNSAFFDSTGGVGGFTFDPDYTQSGPHQVRFIANSNSLADTQLVDITVTEVDRPPVLDPISPQIVAEGDHLDLRVTASDPDGDPIGLLAELLPPNSAFFDSTGGVGGFTFDPDYTQSGPHQVRFIANSNSLADTQLVDITVTEVDRPPVLDPIPPQVVAEGDHLDLRVTASDPDGDPISLVAELTPPNSAFFDSTGGVGGFTFDPDYTQSGLHQVRFIANSNSLADTQLVDITVTNVDLPPVLGPIPPQVVAEGSHLDLRVTASDPDGDAIGLLAELLPPNSAFFDSTGGVGGFTFDPDYTQSGPHQVRFIANSNSLADTQLVDITVTNVDLPPVLDPISPQTLAEGGHLDLRVTASDADGDPIGLLAELLPPNSAFFDSTGGVGGFTFDPDYTQSGLHQVRFIANSNALADTQLVDITVTNVDLPPVLDPIPPQIVAEGDHLDLQVTASDPDGDAIGLVAELLPPNSAFFDSTGGVGGFTFDPDYTQSGPHQVRFIANSNSLADTQLVDITVTNVDLPPVLDPISPQIVAEGDHLDLRVTASDPDGDPIGLLAELLPPNSAFFDSTGGVGGFTFDPDYTQSGPHQVRFIANSNSLADTQLVDITVTEVDRPPVLDPISPQSVDENSHLEIRVTASDFDGDPITLTAEGLPVNANFADSSNGVGGFTFDPDFFQSGDYAVSFIASSNALADTDFVDITVNNVNRTPVLNPIGNRSVIEGGSISFEVTASDPDLETPSLAAQDLPINASFVDSSDGTGQFTFNPDYTQAGTYDVLFIASDGDLADSELVQITVFDAGNQPPEIDYIGPQSIYEGDHLELLISAGDPDGTIPALQGLNLPANSAFVDSGNGNASFTFDPDYTQSGVHNVLFRAYDGDLYDSLWVGITVLDSNRTPILSPIGSQTVTEGSRLEFVVTSSDPDGTTPQLTVGPLPANAVFEDSLNGNGLFTFDPDFTQSGIDTVLFVASDGLLADSEFVQITILEFGNNLPVLDPIGPLSVDEGAQLQVVISASDLDGTIPSLVAEDLPANAVFTDSLNGHGLFDFSPSYFQSGPYQVRFIASDGVASDTELVDITVNDVDRPPVLDPISPQTIAEGDHLDLRITASDPDGDAINLVAELSPPNSAFFDSTGGVGGFTFDPDYTQSGLHQVRLIANSNSLADTQLVDITVTNVDLPPILDPISPQTIAEGDHLDLRVTASDPDGDPISLLAELLPPNSAFFDSTGGVGGFTFDPDYTQSGPHQVRFIASSNSLADTQLVDITVTNVDLPPVFDPISPQTVAEGGHLDLRITASDPDGDPIGLVAELTPPNSAFFDSTGGVGGFTFDPDYTQSGLHQVRFIASANSLADTQLVDITVTNVDLPPVLDPIPPQTVAEGDHLDLRVIASDPDGDPIGLVAELLPPNSAFFDSTGGVGGFTFDPDYTQSGPHQVRFIANSNTLADTQLVDITVTNVDLPPVLDPIPPQVVAEGGHLDLRVTASDPDGDVISLVAELLPPNSAFFDSTGGIGGFVFDPDSTQSGPHQVRFIASANSLADTQMVDITVTDVDLPPVLDPIPPQTIAEGGHLDLRVAASDPDGDPISLIAELLPVNSAFFDSTGGVGGFTFDPDYTQSDLHQVRFIANSNSLADTQLVDITVTNVDLPPVLDPISPQTVAEGDHLDLRVTASDPDGDPISLIAELLPPNSAFFDSTGGVGGFTFDPDYTQSGPHQVRFIANSNSLADTQLVDITVTEVDRPPVLDPISPQTVAEGDHLDLRVTASDPDGDPISLIAELLPPNSAFFDSTGGVGGFTFDPDYTQSGPHQVRFIANSNTLADTQLVDITVTNVDLPPVLAPILPQMVIEGGHLDLRVTASDPDGDAIGLMAELLPPNSAFFDSTGGVGGLTFDPDYTQSGLHQVRFIANSNALSDTQLVDITVLEAGDQPPVWDPISPQTVGEGDHLDLRVTATDPEGDIILLTAELLPPNSAFIDSTGGVGGFTFDPDYFQADLYQVRFIATANAQSDTALVDITVTDTPRPPIWDPIGDRALFEGQTISFGVSASDPDLTIPLLSVDSLPANAAFTDSLNGRGSFSFSPDYTQSGQYILTFIASDGVLSDSEVVSIWVFEAGNQPPEIDSVAPQSVVEAQHLEFVVTSSDPEGSIPALQAFDLPVNAAFADSGNGHGLFTFDPDYTQAGVYYVLFQAFDGELYDSLYVEITVVDFPFAPVLDPIGARIVTEGDTLQFVVTSSDPDGTDPQLLTGPLPANAAFEDSLNGHGLFTFTPDFTQSGIDTVLFIATDGALSDSEYVQITVVEFGNNPPVLDPIGSQTVDEGSLLQVLVTASDPDSTIPLLSTSALPVNATFTDSLNGTGLLEFAPDYLQAGVYFVIFVASDGALADSESVMITINNINRAPVLDSIPTPQTVAEGSLLQLTVTSSDPDTTIPILTAENLPPNATFADSGDGSGDFQFNPDYTQSGSYQVMFISSDGDLADSQYVDIDVIEIDRPPVLDPIPPQTVAEGGHLDLRVTASDLDGDAVSLLAELLPPNSAFFDSTGGVGGFVFDPDYTQSGLHQVRFIANSNSLSDTQLVDITVLEFDRPPVLDPISPQTVDEGGHLDLRLTASDPDGDVISLVAELLPPNSAFFDSTGGVGGFVFDPDYSQSGLHQVRFIASSNSLADTQLVDITVNDVNLPPVLDPIPTPQSVAEGSILEFTVTSYDPDGIFPVLVALNVPVNAVFTDSLNGHGLFEFAPDFTQSGDYQVLFIASDGDLVDSQYVDITVTENNRPPALDSIPTPQSIAETATLEFSVAASDPDGNIPALFAEDLPVNAVFVDSANGVGTFTFTPDYTQSGAYVVLFYATDGQLSDSQYVDITVTDVNASPVITVPGAQVVNESDSLLFTVSASDIDGTIPSLSFFDDPANSSFEDSLNGIGLFRFYPDFTQSGIYTVGFVATDGSLSDTGYVDITVLDAGNQSPVLDPIGSQTVVEGDTLQFVVSATDPDSTIPQLLTDPLPANATFEDSLNGHGLFVFTPVFTQSGVDTVLFIATDGGLSDSEYVQITVIEAGNQVPVLDPIGPQSVGEGDSLLLVVTASDPEGATPTLVALDVPSNGSFVDNGDGTGDFAFYPDYFQEGLYTVTFIASDGVLADTEAVDITVADTPRPPIWDPIGDRALFEGQTISFGVSASDPDLTIPLLSVDSLPANAAFTDSLNGRGSFSFSPDYTQSGQYILTFIASDGVLSDSEVVSIWVFEAGNQPPEIDSVAPQSVVEAQHLEFVITSSDPEGTIPALQAFDLPVNAAFADSGNGHGLFTFDPDYTQAGVYYVLFQAFDGELYDSLYVEITVVDFPFAPVLDPIGARIVTEGDTLEFVVTSSDPDGTDPQLLTGPLPANAAFEDSLNGHGLFTFTPDFTQSGIDTVLFIATDGALSDSEYVQITVVEFGNNPPVLDPIGSQTVDEGSLLQILVTASDPDSTIPLLSTTALPVNATFTDSLNGTGLLEFAPDYFQSGINFVIFIASDGALADSESVMITVNNINRAPVLDSIPTPQTVAEGSLLQLTVTSSDPDTTIPILTAENLPPNATFADSGDGSGGFVFAPDYTQSGSYQVMFISSDGDLADSQYVDIDVIETDRPPVLDPIPPQTISEGGHLDLRVTASDPDGDAVSLLAELLPANSVFFDSTGGVGGFVFDPDYTQSGLHQVRFIANSNSLSDTQLVDITVLEFDRPLVLDPISPQTVDEGGHLDLRLTASDPDGDVISLAAELLPPNSAFFDSTGGVGGFVFDPDYTQSGLHQIRFIASSNSLADTQLVDITVNDVNLPPVLDPIPPQTVAEGGHLDLRISASDPDGDPIALVAELLPPNSAFFDSTGGIGGFTFDPDYTQSGLHQVRFIANSDSFADTQLVDITVTETDRPPVLDPISPQTVAEGDHLDLRVTASDPDGDPISLLAELLPPNSAFLDSTGGVGGFTFDPDYTQSGLHQVRFIANSNSSADTQLVDITVTELDRPPVLDPISPQAVAEGDHLDLRVTASDPDGDAIGLVAELIPPNSVFFDSTGGVGGFIFDPDYTQSGLHQVRFIANSNSLADTQLVDITVTNVDLPPVLAPILPQMVIEGGHLDLRVTASDPDGDVISLVAELLPPNSAFFDSTGGVGGFIFDPDYTQSGLHQVRFIANSNALSDTQLVDITVTEAGDQPPVWDPISPQTVGEGDHLDLRVTATDPEGDIISLTAELLPPNSAFFDSTGGVGGFAFDPDYFQAGLYLVRFIATANALSDTALVDITVENVNRAPDWDPIGNRALFEGESISFIVTAKDPDLTIPSLSIDSLPANAAFTDSLNGHGLFSFSPDYTQAGEYILTFIASDGVLSDSEVVSIFVFDAGNQPPAIDSIGPQSVVEGEHLEFVVTSSDPDGTIPALQVLNLPLNAAFADSGNGHGLFTFDPDYTQAGLHNVLFRAFDGELYDSLYVEITVIDFGFPPLLDPIGPQTVTEGDTLSLVVTASDPDGTIPQLITGPLPVNASFEDSLNGSGLFTFTPDYTQSGVDTVLFMATDGALSDSEYVEITVVEAGNQPPGLNPIGPQTVDEGDTLIVIISASDPDSTIPVLSAVGLPPNATFNDNFDGTGTFEFMPDYTQAGLDTVLFIAADASLADSEYVELTIYDVNLPPILTPIGPHSTDEGVLLQILVTAIDPDGTIPSLTADSLPPNATFVDSSNGVGLFEFVPDFDQAGVYNVLFTASDGFLADSELVEITVVDIDLPPLFDPVGDQQVMEGDSLFFTVHAVDPEGLIPWLSVDLLPFNAVFTDSGNGTGLYEYRPDYTQSGVDSIAFFASDGLLTDTLKIQITTLEAGNRRPVLAPIGSKIVDEDQLLQFNVYGSDADDGPPSLQVGSLPLGASFYDSTNGVGTFSFTPNFFQSGIYNVLFFATDGTLADSESVQITVNHVNQPPELSPIGNQAIFEDDSLGLDIMATDLDGDPLVITAEPLEINMSFTDNGDGTAFFQFMPDFTQAGIYLVTFAVTDGVDADTDLVQIDVIEVGNQPPVLAPIDTAYHITEGYLFVLPISATDLDADSLILSADSLVENMTFVDNGDGSGLFTFAPSYVQAGTYPVTFRVFDGQVYDSAQTTIYVAEEGNQPPILDPIGAQTVAEGDSLVLNISATDPEGFPPVLLVSDEPDSSYFTDNGDGTGRFVYYPDFYSADSNIVRFTAMDDGGLTAYEDVPITVTDVNLPPFIVFVGDTLVHEGDTLVATVIATDSSDYEPGPISLSHGYLPPNSDFVITGNGVGEFRFYPDFEQTGLDSAYFYAVDSDSPPMSDEKWVRLTVLSSNRPPVLEQPQGGSVDQGDTLTIDLLATDPDGDSIVLFINCDCPDPLPPRSEFHDFGDGTGQFIFYPDYTQTGIFIIYFAATDGEYIDTKPTLVQVIDLGNQQPTLNPIGPLSVLEGDSLEVLISATDPDSTFPAFTIEDAPYNLVLTDSSNGYAVLSYVPFYNQSGIYQMLIFADDGDGAADSEYVDLTVIEAGNQYPELQPISDTTITEGESLQFSVFATDPDSTMPVMDTHNLPENSGFSDQGDGSGQFSFDPGFFQSGDYLITFLAIDAEDAAIADSQIVTITVIDLNRRPEFENINPINIMEGENLNITIVSSDPDSTVPTLEILISPNNSSFVDNGDGTGTFDFNPDYFQAGVDSALFLAVDEIDPELFDEMMVYFIIEDVNRPPVLSPIPDTSIGDGFMLNLDIVTTDPDLTIPLLFHRNMPDSAEFSDYGDGTALFSWRPRFEDIGIYQITFGCYDQIDSSLADSQLVTIEVITSGNHPPVFVPIPDQTIDAEDTLDLLVVAADPEGDPITLSYAGVLPFGMTFVDSGGGIGSLHWVPTMDQGGDTTVTLVATESFGLTDTLRVNITVLTFIRGDIDANGIAGELADVILLIVFYRGETEIPDPQERADVDGDGDIGDLGDLIYLIAYYRGTGDPPPPPSPPGGGRLGVIPRNIMNFETGRQR